MPTGTLNFQVVAIGPSDVQQELRSIEPVVAKLSREFLARNVTLSFHHWSKLPPGIGTAQSYIDKHIRWEHVDFVVGAMWKKFGSPVADADSGTEHECNEILKCAGRGQPDLLFYFRETSDVEQSGDFSKIQAFRTSLQQKALVATYTDLKTFPEQVEIAIRSKIDGMLLSQKQTQRRMGDLPINRSFTVELIVFAEFPEKGQTPTIIILKDSHERLFVVDTRYSTGQQITNWIAQTMGYAVTEGMTLNDFLKESNVQNVKSNNGIIQLWLGNIVFADHPTFKMKDVKIMLGNVSQHNGKPGFDLSKPVPIQMLKPNIIVNPDGSKSIRL